MRIAIVYTSVTGNTKELAALVHERFTLRSVDVEIFPIKQFPLNSISEYDGIAIGTYTWGNGSIPREMKNLFSKIEEFGTKRLSTAVFGTGDSFFPYFCGAVDAFRDMLYVRTNLAVTMKVEQRPQFKDVAKCSRFVECLLDQIRKELEVVSR
ncbi:flavodoxin domain-containing protein [Virgibacillus oceani]|uniref:Flavodoxin-1 n=1 Tax=Virgibacillus oceani TaxID=1479511 RepID=A0A917H921_9BACI|nr:flavodoxin domain-containing protein [Virgibacillus oceani]GGG71144.1 putative flavodoxin-1 [Virgibacillus oceani]